MNWSRLSWLKSFPGIGLSPKDFFTPIQHYIIEWDSVSSTWKQGRVSGIVQHMHPLPKDPQFLQALISKGPHHTHLTESPFLLLEVSFVACQAAIHRSSMEAGLGRTDGRNDN